MADDEEMAKLRSEVAHLRLSLATATCDALVAAHAEITRLATERDEMVQLRPIDTWHEDDGNVLLWRVPIVEPPYCGSPLEDGFPEDYYTHWSKLPKVEDPVQTVYADHQRR